MKKLETLFQSKTETDRKSKLNKLNRTINQSILDKIEKGVTIEDLEAMQKSGLPILKYGTQITIHGLFPDLENNYIFGYKNIFQNKNKSIGVKYNAIDESKRIRIQKRLNTIGFSYVRNSTDTGYHIIREINETNFETVKAELFGLKNKVNENLFFGSVHIWKGQGWGVQYLCLDLYINAIYERNIEAFLNELGATEAVLNEVIKQAETEDNERKARYERERKESELKRKEALEANSKDLDLLNKFNRVEKHTEPGLYLLRTFNYNDELVYKVVYLYMPTGKKKCRFNKREYININEALKHEPSEGYSDRIYGGRVTGYQLQ